MRIWTKPRDDFEVVEQLRPMIAAYCQRRGSRDPEGIAAEVITIAWTQRDLLDLRHCRSWLIATARNLLFDEYRARKRSVPIDPATLIKFDRRSEPDFEVDSLDPELGRALEALSPSDREAVLLIAWDELTPSEAARSMKISPATFRVRLHRARRRLRRSLEEDASAVETRSNPVQEAI